jgi:hypothetical protein
MGLCVEYKAYFGNKVFLKLKYYKTKVFRRQANEYFIFLKPPFFSVF